MNVGVTSFHHILIYSHLFIVHLFLFSSFPLFLFSSFPLFLPSSHPHILISSYPPILTSSLPHVFVFEEDGEEDSDHQRVAGEDEPYGWPAAGAVDTDKEPRLVPVAELVHDGLCA